MGQTPVQVVEFDSGYVVQPSWTYDLGSGNYANGLKISILDFATPFDSSVIFVSVGGSSPKIACLFTDGTFAWQQGFSNAPTSVVSYYYLGSYYIAFCEGNNLRAGTVTATAFTEAGWSPVGLGGTGGTPIRIQEGAGPFVNKLYVAAGNGTLYKIDPENSGNIDWSRAGISANPDAGLAVLQNDRVFVGCTNGDVRTYDISNTPLNSTNLTNSVNNGIRYGNSTAYVTPNNNLLYALNTNLSTKWSLNLGAVTYTSPLYYYAGSDTALYCGAGNTLRKVKDNGTSGSIQWTYYTNNTVSTDPSALGGVVYFSSDDKRNFAVSILNGTNISGWPSTVLEGENQSRVVVDMNYSNSVFFGGGDGKLYRYPMQ
jgi:hypothetical protein